MPAVRSNRQLLVALALAGAAHLVTFLALQPRLQPWYFERDVGIERNAWNPLITDATTYGNLAADLLREGSYTSEGRPHTTHMPGTAWLMALSKRTVGHLGLFGAVEAAILLLGTFVYASAAARLHGPGVAATAMFLSLVQPLVLFSSWTVNSDAIHVGCFLAFLALASRSTPHLRAACGAGGLLGLSCYFREVALADAIGAAVGLARGRRPGSRRTGALFLGAFLLTLAPWVTRNLRAGAGPLLTTSKAPEIFFTCSFGLTLRDVNPFDIDEGGALSLADVNTRAAARLAEDGFGPDRPADDAYFIGAGLANYVAHPLAQAQSFVIKAGNLFRPPIARRHLIGFLPGGAATAGWAVLALEHLLLIGVGLYVLVRRSPPAAGALGGALVGTLVVSMAIWTEPRYLVPFYLPLTVLAVDALATRWRRREPA